MSTPLQLNLFDLMGSPIIPALNDVFPNNESDELEYKAALGGFPEDFWKTYSAFANTNGGTIILGVKERKGQLSVEGLDKEKIRKCKKHFWDSANNPNTVSINLCVAADVKEFMYSDKLLLAIRVPAAIRTQKPVFLTRNPFNNTYKRNHEGDYSCPKEEVRRMLADADTNTHPDSRILEGFDFSDIDLNSLNQYRQIFASTRTGHPWLTLDNKEFLIKLGGYRTERATKKEGLTLAALLMFGKSSSITESECAPNFFPDFREILSTDPDVRWTDRIYPDGTWESNLFQFYLKVWPKLAASLPKPFQIKNGRRQDETPAHIALREAFVNTIIHTDYTAPGNVIIVHKTDTFRFSNPGTLLVTLQQYYQGGISECRNVSLQKMFLMIGSAEKAGSGVNKIMAGWEYAHWRNPYLLIESQPDRIILELPMFNILPEETLNSLRAMFGTQIDALGKNELTILATCHIEGEITNSRLQYMIDRHRTDITKILQDLCKQGYLLSDNKGRWTSYRLNSDFNNLDTLTPNLDTLVPNLDTLTPNLDTLIPNLDSSDKLPKRLKREELENTILDNCKDAYYTVEQIAKKVERKAAYLQNEILPKLMKEGKIMMQYPDTQNHPNQAYKTVE